MSERVIKGYHAEAGEALGLTRRELEVLRLVADGLHDEPLQFVGVLRLGPEEPGLDGPAAGGVQGRGVRNGDLIHLTRP